MNREENVIACNHNTFFTKEIVFEIYKDALGKEVIPVKIEAEQSLIRYNFKTGFRQNNVKIKTSVLDKRIVSAIFENQIQSCTFIIKTRNILGIDTEVKYTFDNWFSIELIFGEDSMGEVNGFTIIVKQESPTIPPLTFAE